MCQLPLVLYRNELAGGDAMPMACNWKKKGIINNRIKIFLLGA